ncbi:MAG: GNAT family N-acetyltransferase [Chthonomonas sp.]|nr:GNAT family N-acetyltransferase [Chthonomonas sp.]
MGLTYHELGPADRAELVDLWSEVYNRGQQFEEGRLSRDFEMPVGVRYDNRLVAAASIHSFDFSRGSASLHGGGVAMVAVRPDSRGIGAGTALVRGVLESLHTHGYDLSVLYGFRERFYRPFGYELAGDSVLVRCPSHLFPKISPQLNVRRISPDELHLLQPAYDGFRANHAGIARRGPAEWQNRMGLRAPMIYGAGDPVEAYAWTSMEGGFFDEFQMGEFVWSTRRGYETILDCIRGLAFNRSAAKWTEPSPSPFQHRFADEGITFTNHRVAMWRIVNLPQALERLSGRGAGVFSLEVEDPRFPQVHGAWRVEFDASGTHVQRASGGTIKLKVGTLSQALMGQPSVTALMEMGMIESRDAAEFQAMQNLLTPQSVFCSEFF